MLPCLFFAFPGEGQIRYFQKPALAQQSVITQPIIAPLQDSIVNDTLFLELSKEGFPLCYYRNIETPVCFDNKCRLLLVTIFWNPTGRYLGFELPPKEFFSKAEHKPFIPGEYERMSVILADRLSPLGTLAYSEIAPPKAGLQVSEPVDAVSSATAKNILEYVVEGAAFTTYKMWNIVYGSTQDDIEKHSKGLLSADLVLALLDSPDNFDRIWALSHITAQVLITRSLQDKLLSLANNINYVLAERAIAALPQQETTWQSALSEGLPSKTYALQKLIIAKLKSATQLNEPARNHLASALQSPNSELVSSILDTFRKHQVRDLKTCRVAAGLLSSPNRLIAGKAFSFLENASPSDKVITQKMREYKSKQ